MKKAILSVTSDLCTDQRVHRTALALQKLNYEVLLIGRKKYGSAALEPKSYKCIRFTLFFEKKLLFYAEYHIRLFVYLLFHKADLLYANDLDTLLPNFIFSKIKGVPLIYDSHEYFTGVPELTNRPIVREFWEGLEEFILPKLKSMITVSDSIAQLYREQYGIHVEVIRNVPISFIPALIKSKSDFGIPEGAKIILYQGAGINVDRGLEEMVEAMQFIDQGVLLIVGGGDVLEILKQKVRTLGLSGKVIFAGKFSPVVLKSITPLADIGLSLDKNNNMNYRFSLPNKLFDYIHAGVPVIATPLPEIKKIMEQYEVGTYLYSHDPKTIAQTINEVLAHHDLLMRWKLNCLRAAADLCWEVEEEKLLDVIKVSTSNN